MIDKIKVIIGLIFWFASASAQTDIETQLIFADTVNYPFTSEWQYLSSDVYLFNARTFDKLINEMSFNDIGRKHFFRAHTDEKLEFLFVSARLKNVKFLNNTDLVYPLYNFQVNRDADKKYHTFVSDNIDHIRLIDNMPLYSAGNNIDAEIKVQAITNNNSDLLLNMIGSQLKNLSKITNPGEAVFSLIGEFGNLIESNTKKKEYHFSSTIRIYDQQTFDTRLHSVKIYVMKTGKSSVDQPDFRQLVTYLDSAKNPKPDRALLQQLIGFSDYPVLVVLNYRSMYQMNRISGDEVTQDAIDERRARILTDYKNGLISEETYRQERDFIRFLTAFVDLKNNLELYKLNQGSGNLNATKNSLPKVISRYNNLLTIRDEMEQKYSTSPVFTNIFKGEYGDIVDFANLYLDGDPNLNSAKELVNLLRKLEKEGTAHLDSVKAEKMLSALHSAMAMGDEFATKTAEGQQTAEYISRIEKQYFAKYIQPQLTKLPKDEDAFVSKIKDFMGQTQCELCRDESSRVLTELNRRLENKRLEQALKKKDSLGVVLTDSLIRYTRYQQCLTTNLLKIKQGAVTRLPFDLVQYHVQRLQMHLDGLNTKLKVQFDQPQSETILRFNESLEAENEEIQRSLNFFRRNAPCMFNCECPELIVPKPGPDSVPLQKTDSLVRAGKNQLNIFRQFDLMIYSGAEKHGNDSTLNLKLQLIETNRQLMDSLAKQINQIPGQLAPEELKNTKQRLHSLIEQIGENLNAFCMKFPQECIENQQ